MQSSVVFTSRHITEAETGAETTMEPELFPPRGVGTGQGQDWTSRGEDSRRTGDDESVEMLLVLTDLLRLIVAIF